MEREMFPTVVADIMSSPVIKIDGEANVRDAALLMMDKGIGCIIVMGRGRPIGIVTERDILERVVAPCRDPCEVKVKEIMSTPLITISKDESILEAMRRMRKHGIGRLVVMEDERLEGIVTDGDILRAVSLSALSSFKTLLHIG